MWHEGGVAGRFGLLLDRRRARDHQHAKAGGDLAVLLEDVPRTASVRATADMTVLSLGREDFLQLVGGNPFARKRLNSISRQRTHDLMEAL